MKHEPLKKKAIIFDLDNTLYAADSIGEALFSHLFTLIKDEGNHGHEIDDIKRDILRKPFQQVAVKYNFSKTLTERATAHLKYLSYTGTAEVFQDYSFIQNLSVEKYLVTSGFMKLQLSKIDALGIENDFKEIHILDSTTTKKTKRDTFEDILFRNKLNPENVLVVGDDLESEIKAAFELGIDAVLYDYKSAFKGNSNVYVITNYRKLIEYL